MCKTSLDLEIIIISRTSLYTACSLDLDRMLGIDVLGIHYKVGVDEKIMMSERILDGDVDYILTFGLVANSCQRGEYFDGHL